MKLQNLPEKWEKHLYILCILKKITLTTENRSSVLHNLFLLDMSIFNGLVIKNDPAKKVKSYVFFMKGVQLHHNQVLVLLGRLYRNSKFSILENFNLFFCQLQKKFRVSQSLVKDIQRFGQFSHRYFNSERSN